MGKKLSTNAIGDLRIALTETYGFDITKELTDNEVNQLGNFYLTLYSIELKRQEELL